MVFDVIRISLCSPARAERPLRCPMLLRLTMGQSPRRPLHSFLPLLLLLLHLSLLLCALRQRKPPVCALRGRESRPLLPAGTSAVNVCVCVYVCVCVCFCVCVCVCVCCIVKVAWLVLRFSGPFPLCFFFVFVFCFTIAYACAYQCVVDCASIQAMAGLAGLLYAEV